MIDDQELLQDMDPDDLNLQLDTELTPIENETSSSTSPLDLRRQEELGSEGDPELFLDDESEDNDNPKTLLPQFRKLQDRDTTFVFLFGKQQAGKTVIISSLAYHMGVDDQGHLETRRRHDNLKGASYLKNLYQTVRSGLFMDRTAVGSLYELDLKYTPARPRKSMHFTFLEMSGEDLSKVELSEHSAGELPSNIDIFLKCHGLDLVFMMVAPYDEAEDHDHLMIDFLDYVSEKNPQFSYSKVILLISKWDRYEGRQVEDVENFVREQMPRTYSRLKARSGSLARYCIGEVTDTNEYIVDFNHERPDSIKRWLYKAITGKKIKSEKPWFKRIGAS